MTGFDAWMAPADGLRLAAANEIAVLLHVRGRKDRAPVPAHLDALLHQLELRRQVLVARLRAQLGREETLNVVRVQFCVVTLGGTRRVLRKHRYADVVSKLAHHAHEREQVVAERPRDVVVSAWVPDDDGKHGRARNERAAFEFHHGPSVRRRSLRSDRHVRVPFVIHAFCDKFGFVRRPGADVDEVRSLASRLDAFDKNVLKTAYGCSQDGNACDGFLGDPARLKEVEHEHGVNKAHVVEDVHDSFLSFVHISRTVFAVPSHVECDVSE
mmetsp:Transcript_11002/g.27881  ORF Transcript_11002/g.27881 Transcript_11002/m.27881 type:complete len:270 (+) Transcript_11002:83-892(+)